MQEHIAAQAVSHPLRREILDALSSGKHNPILGQLSSVSIDRLAANYWGSCGGSPKRQPETDASARA